jgi:hypothetical protein
MSRGRETAKRAQVPLQGLAPFHLNEFAAHPQGEAMVEIRREECVTCGTGFLVRVCSNCAVGSDAWRIIWPRGVDIPPEIRDSAGRVGQEHKKAIDGILDEEFGGQVTMKNLAAAVSLHIQRQADLAEAQRLAAAASADAQRLAHSRHLASRLQKHSDLVAERTAIARIKRVGNTLRSLLGF